MENVKEYFMDTKCHPSNRDADWDLADEYRKLKIDKKIVIVSKNIDEIIY